MNKIVFNQKTVILRTDYNVPILDGKITSSARIDASLKTIHHILHHKASRIIIISHLGRPRTIDPQLSLKPVKKYLQSILSKDIYFANLEDYILNSEKISQRIVMLENIRYYPEETQELPTTPNFRKRLTSLGDVFVNDAFGCSHRNHSSIVGIRCPERCCGFLIRKEVKFLQDIFEGEGVVTLILGGSKVSDKIKLISNLIPKVDHILIGGGMAFTFLKYFGYQIGSSLFDEDGFKIIPEIIENARIHQTEIVLPTDFMCNNNFSNTGDVICTDLSTGIPENYMGLDIGKATIKNFSTYLQKSDKIIWNGPVGVFEFDNFANGSQEIMKLLERHDGITVIGGGDTSACCEQFGNKDKITHLSTGGGASLEMLEGKKLPGLKFEFSKSW